jgi:hypothetical protein
MIDDELQPSPANLPNLVLLDISQNEDDSSGGEISPERLENSVNQVAVYHPRDMLEIVPVEFQMMP